jgi:hypothetical protein
MWLDYIETRDSRWLSLNKPLVMRFPRNLPVSQRPKIKIISNKEYINNLLFVFVFVFFLNNTTSHNFS